MSRSSNGRVLRRQVKKGMLEEIKRRTGRDASSDSATRRMLEERVWEKQREKQIDDNTLIKGE